jgi:hypothetical protein
MEFEPIFLGIFMLTLPQTGDIIPNIVKIVRFLLKYNEKDVVFVPPESYLYRDRGCAVPDDRAAGRLLVRGLPLQKLHHEIPA